MNGNTFVLFHIDWTPYWLLLINLSQPILKTFHRTWPNWKERCRNMAIFCQFRNIGIKFPSPLNFELHFLNKNANNAMSHSKVCKLALFCIQNKQLCKHFSFLISIQNFCLLENKKQNVKKSVDSKFRIGFWWWTRHKLFYVAISNWLYDKI